MGPLKALLLATSILFLLAANATAQTRTLYFYPPSDAKWIAGKSYIYDLEHSPRALMLDSTRCGWYKVAFQAGDPLLDFAQIWLGKAGIDKIGPNGRQQSSDYEGNPNDAIALGAFRPKEIFASLNANNIYFVADELDPSSPNSGWYNSDPGYIDSRRCQFSLAAYIYDTDVSVHPDFSCGEYSQGMDYGNGLNTKANCTLASPYSTVDAKTPGGNKKGKCTGVHRGIVQKDIVKSPDGKRKMKYAGKGVGKDEWDCWTDESWFDKAFNPTEGVNVQRCYDMPFTQVKSGSTAGNFEFDSNKMLNANGRLVGGFYPQLLTNRDGADYSKCPNCDAKRPAESFAPLKKSISADAFDNYIPRDGEFADGDHPAARDIVPSATGIEGVWNWANISDSPNGLESETREGLSWYLHGTTAIKGKDMAPANQFFCFESHATFIYDPEQTFIFRGDDDIYVFINDKLAIDLGGTHLAAPSKVELAKEASKLGLIEGNEYPIDIFFCDRRSTMSNVRINTNIYVSQNVKFIPDPVQEEKKTYMCATVSGGGACGGGGKELCGPKLTENGYSVEFYMLKRGNVKDTIWLSPVKNSSECKGNIKDFTCYDGIRIEDASYSCGGYTKCQGTAGASKVQVPGNTVVYAMLKDKYGIQLGEANVIDRFRGETTPIIPRSFAHNIKARVNAGTILLENLPAGAKVELYNLQGKRIYSTTNNSPLATSHLKIGVQAKGMYIIKVSLGNKILTFNRSVYE